MIAGRAAGGHRVVAKNRREEVRIKKAAQRAARQSTGDQGSTSAVDSITPAQYNELRSLFDHMDADSSGQAPNLHAGVSLTTSLPTSSGHHHH